MVDVVLSLDSPACVLGAILSAKLLHEEQPRLAGMDELTAGVLLKVEVPVLCTLEHGAGEGVGYYAAFELSAEDIEAVHLSHCVLGITVAIVLKDRMALVPACERVFWELDTIDISKG